jgi:glutamate synthase (NADPH/NADH) small chain
VPIAGSEFDLPLSVAVIAIGTSANPIVQSTTPGLQTNKRGYSADRHPADIHKGVFAGTATW